MVKTGYLERVVQKGSDSTTGMTRGQQRMFMLRSDMVLVMYEETSPHLPLENQIRKEFFNLKLAGDLSAVTNLKPMSIQVAFHGEDKVKNNLILTFSNKDEREDWYLLMSG
jgi:hypothetical protein